VKSHLARQRQLQAWLQVLAAALVVFYAKEAWVSGSHAIRFLEPKFIYEYDDGRRKSFHSSQDANEYFASKKQDSTKAFIAALPLFGQFFQDAAQHGVRLGELRLRTLNQKALSNAPLGTPAELVGKATDEYPRLVKLNLNATDKQAYDSNHLILVLEKAPDQNQATWLWEQAGTLRFAKISQRDAEMAAVSEEATKRFQPGVAAVKMGSNFALAVGLTDELRPENAALFQAQAEALAKEIWPMLQSAFQNEELLKAFFTGDPKQLVSVEKKLGKRPDDKALAPLFNPYGPLLDALGMRSTVQVGGLRVGLLFVAKNGDPIPQPTYALTQWLLRATDGPARDGDAIGLLLKSAQNAHDPSAQKAAIDELVRLAKEPVLRKVGGQRIIDFFVQHALSDAQSKDPLRMLAIENLRWIDCPERRRVYFDLLKTHRSEGAMGVISQAFGDFPDNETTAALIAAANDAKASEDSRSWARYGLKSQLAVLERSTDPKTAALKERVKRAMANQP
jgi:hypothetical protein